MPKFTFRTPVVDSRTKYRFRSPHGSVSYHYEEITIFAYFKWQAEEKRKELKDKGIISGIYATEGYLELERQRRKELYANVY